MRTEIKYLGIGLFIGLAATTLLLAGMIVPPTVAASMPTDTPTATKIPYTPSPQPSPTIRPPTNTYTPTPTLIRLKSVTPSNTPSPTPTLPSPTPTFADTMRGMLENGYLTNSGPMTFRQQILVYGASVIYMRQTSEDSRIIGEEINGPGYGSPTDICGPLSISILQDAGIIDPTLDPHAYWLFNPDVEDDRRLLAKAFPPEIYDSTRVRTNLDKVDWNESPLYAGDFLYLYAGTGGNFEHMLVVNRVDSQGRAFAVTNHYTPDGFIISEVLLYHPAKSNVGMFPVWTEWPNKMEGSTGFGGYEVWRLKTPKIEPET